MRHRIVNIIFSLLFICCFENSNGQLQLILSDSSGFAFDIYCFGKDTVFISGNSKIVRTYNGGATWDSVYFGDSLNLIQRIDFSNATYGYGINNYGCLFRTTDGGNSWDLVDSIANQYFSDVEAIDSITAVIVTYSSVLKTNDAGLTFDTVAQPIVCGFNTGGYDFSFINKQIGYIGSSCMGTVFTNDSGYTWSVLFWNNSMEFHDISFINQQYGWAIDRSFSPWEHIAFTQDGGFSWQMEPVFGFQKFGAMDFNQNGVGVAATLNGNIYITVDSGITWNLYQHLPLYYTKAKVTDDSTIYIASLYGIYKISNLTVGLNSIGEIAKNVKVFPTLFSDFIKIQNNNLQWKFIDVTVYSLIGSVVASKRFYETNNTLDLNWVAPGNYIFRVQAPDGSVQSFKTVKL